MFKMNMNRAITFLSFILFLLVSFLQAEDVPWDPIPMRSALQEDTSRASISYSPSTWLIAFHQQILSECDGPRSHFYPTSSEYMKYAIRQYGIKGILLGMDRLLRENDDPWVYTYVQKGTTYRKWDPVP